MNLSVYCYTVLVPELEAIALSVTQVVPSQSLVLATHEGVVTFPSPRWVKVWTDFTIEFCTSLNFLDLVVAICLVNLAVLRCYLLMNSWLHENNVGFTKPTIKKAYSLRFIKITRNVTLYTLELRAMITEWEGGNELREMAPLRQVIGTLDCLG